MFRINNNVSRDNVDFYVEQGNCDHLCNHLCIVETQSESAAIGPKGYLL